MDIFPLVENISKVEVLIVHKTSFLESVGEGQPDKGDELLSGPCGVVGELLLLKPQMGTSNTFIVNKNLSVKPHGLDKFKVSVFSTLK